MWPTYRKREDCMMDKELDASKLILMGTVGLWGVNSEGNANKKQHKQNYLRRSELIKVQTYGRAMAQAVSRRPLTEARFRSWVSPCRICGGQSGTGIGFSPRVRRISPVNFISPVLHYTEKQ
jgi:hypothetical protein